MTTESEVTGCRSACEKAKTCYWHVDSGCRNDTRMPLASGLGRDVWPYCQYYLSTGPLA